MFLLLPSFQEVMKLLITWKALKRTWLGMRLNVQKRHPFLYEDHWENQWLLPKEILPRCMYMCNHGKFLPNRDSFHMTKLPGPKLLNDHQCHRDIHGEVSGLVGSMKIKGDEGKCNQSLRSKFRRKLEERHTAGFSLTAEKRMVEIAFEVCQQHWSQFHREATHLNLKQVTEPGYTICSEIGNWVVLNFQVLFQGRFWFNGPVSPLEKYRSTGWHKWSFLPLIYNFLNILFRERIRYPLVLFSLPL